MTSLFNITTATSSITLDARRTGKASFTVTNTGGTAIRARARVTSPDTSILSWFTIDGDIVRDMAPAATTQFTVLIAVPPTAAPKDYTFSLLMVDESNPDENYTEGPGVRVTVPAPVPVPEKKPFPWWIVAVAVIAIVVIIIAVAVIVNQNNRALANATATQNAVNTATSVANGIATQTAFPLTQTALAPTATRTPTATPTSTPRPNADITVANNGGVIAQFTVTYDLNGAQQSQSSGSILLGADTTLTIPGAATSVRVVITFNTSNATCTRFYDQATSVTIGLSGTIFNPQCFGG